MRIRPLHIYWRVYNFSSCRHIGGDLDLNPADELTGPESFTSTRLIQNAPSRSSQAISLALFARSTKARAFPI